ncbi:MAG: hypothetical protein J0H54_06355 [Rhizobiales bacterium]|nr:hypothetical protein [Hyphomicrobiales bacterium]
MAALVLLLVAFIAVAGASYLAGYVRVEYGDAPKSAASAPDEMAAEPVAEAPPAVAAMPPPPAPAEPAVIAPPAVADTPEPAADRSVRVVGPAILPPDPAPQKDIARLQPFAAPPEPAPEPAPAPEAEETEAADAAGPPAIVAAAPRLVVAPGITPAPVSREELPREPVPPRAPDPPRWQPYRHVMVLEAGLLDLGKRSVELAGVVPAPRDRNCRAGAETAERPCALLALQAMRQRIRGLGVECRIAADAVEDPDYAEAEKEARCGARGMWRDAETPGDCPSR